jgi:hypothetical protein
MTMLLALVGCVPTASSSTQSSTATPKKGYTEELTYSALGEQYFVRNSSKSTGSDKIKFLDTPKYAENSDISNTLTFDIPSKDLSGLADKDTGLFGKLITGELSKGEAKLLAKAEISSTSGTSNNKAANVLYAETGSNSGQTSYSSSSDASSSVSSESTVATNDTTSGEFVTYRVGADSGDLSIRFNAMLAAAASSENENNKSFDYTKNTSITSKLIVMTSENEKVTNIRPCDVTINIVDKTNPKQKDSSAINLSYSDSNSNYVSYSDDKIKADDQLASLKKDIRANFTDNGGTEDLNVTFCDSNGQAFDENTTADTILGVVRNNAKITNGRFDPAPLSFVVSDYSGNTTEKITANITLKDDIEPYIIKGAENKPIDTGTITSGLTKEDKPYPTSEFKSILLDSIAKQQYKIYDKIAYPYGEDFSPTNKHISVDEDSDGGKIRISITDESGNVTSVTTDSTQHVKVNDSIISENPINGVSTNVNYYFINNSSCDVAVTNCNPSGNIVELQKPISVTRSGTTFPCDITQYGLGSDTTSYYADSNDQKNIKFDLGSCSKNITIATDAIRLSGASNQTISIYNSEKIQKR